MRVLICKHFLEYFYKHLKKCGQINQHRITKKMNIKIRPAIQALTIALAYFGILYFLYPESTGTKSTQKIRGEKIFSVYGKGSHTLPDGTKSFGYIIQIGEEFEFIAVAGSENKETPSFMMESHEPGKGVRYSEITLEDSPPPIQIYELGEQKTSQAD